MRLGRPVGAHERTLYGLAGVGDLIAATCATSRSRNHAVGVRLARGEPLDAIVRSGVTAEGLGTVRSVTAYADHAELRLPIAQATLFVTRGDRSAESALRDLLLGDPRNEWEDGSG
ncbi:MAG: NAD(P)H-dependent glycerol-3-phosphate dehydrogenase [Trueperaceae bacterium]